MLPVHLTARHIIAWPLHRNFVKLQKKRPTAGRRLLVFNLFSATLKQLSKCVQSCTKGIIKVHEGMR